MENKLTGILAVINDTVQINETFKKREFVLETVNDIYPQTVLLELTQNNVGLLDALKVGDYIEVIFEIRGRQWTKPETGEIKYFNSLHCFKINYLTQGQNPPETTDEATPPKSADDLKKKTEAKDNDLPF